MYMQLRLTWTTISYQLPPPANVTVAAAAALPLGCKCSPVESNLGDEWTNVVGVGFNKALNGMHRSLAPGLLLKA